MLCNLYAGINFEGANEYGRVLPKLSKYLVNK